MRRVPAALLALVLGVGLEACDPCAGVIGCTGAARMSAEGQLIVRETGVGVRGVALDFVRTGGVALLGDSVRTTTDADGRFQLTAEASTVGEVVGDLVVRPSLPWQPYRVRGLRLRTSSVRGEGQILGRILVRPYIDFIAELRLRRTDRPLAGARVTIVRTGGVAVSPDSVRLVSGPDGRIYFGADAAEPGELVADLIVTSSSLPRPSRLSGVALPAGYLDRVPVVGAVWRFGSALPYVGELFHRSTGARSAGIEVEFRRTGGILVDPASFTVHTGPDGRFPLNRSIPRTDGDVLGVLIVRPPAPAAAETIPAVRMPTVDTDALILLGVFGYGQQILYAGEVYLRGTGQLAAGVDVEFRRTGGITIAPDSFVVRTNADGRFPLAPSTSSQGEVVGALVIRLPTPYAPDTIPGVRLATFASDEMRFLGRWGVGPSLQYVGEVLRVDTDAPIMDATIEFQRTGGIPVTSTLPTIRTNAAGRFPFGLAPQGSGEVVGTLTIHPPAPFRDTTFTGVRLLTFANDSARFAGVWRIAPPQ